MIPNPLSLIRENSNVDLIKIQKYHYLSLDNKKTN